MARQRRKKGVNWYKAWLRLIDAAGWHCPRCGVRLSVTTDGGRASLSNPAFPEIDHVVALHKNGRDDESNWQILCRRCNRQKGTK